MSIKENRRLFLITLFLFTLCGFGFKWMISEFGWFSGTKKKIVIQPVASLQKAPVTEKDLIKAREVVGKFFSLYYSKNKDQLEADTTKKLFVLLKEEAENPLKEKEEKLERVENVECTVVSGGIHCCTTVHVSASGEEGTKKMVEHVYDVKLLLEGVSWLIDEVSARGSFE